MASISKTVRPKRSNNASVNPVGHGLTVGRGTPVVVGAGATTITVTTHPAGAVNGVTFTTQPVVQLRNGSGSAVAESGITVTAYLSSGSGTLGGTKQVVTDANGIATFTNLSITGSGSHTVSFHALMSAVQTIWSDDVETDRSSSYFEVNTDGGVFGRASVDGSMQWRSQYATGGSQSWGDLKLGIGRMPSGGGFTSVGPSGVDFGLVTMECDMYHSTNNLTDDQDKFARMTVFSASDWSQAAIAHWWSNGTTHMEMDPVTLTDANGNVLGSGYNDFAHMTFLGLTPCSTTVFGSTATTPRRYRCVWRLNDPGQSNGYQHMYLNGVLEGQINNLNFVSTYTGYGINTVMWENYRTGGSGKNHNRMFDNLTVTGQARAVVAASALTVGAGGGGGSGGPNEPAGMTVGFDEAWLTAPPAASSGSAWFTEVHPDRVSIITDPTSPVSDHKCLQLFFPSGATGGVEPMVIGWSESPGFPANTGTLYLRIRLKMSANWSDNGNGIIKFCWPRTIPNTTNHYIPLNAADAPAGGFRTGFCFQAAFLGGADDDNFEPTSHPVDTWYDVEYLLFQGTSAAAANGTIDVWVDGVHTLSVTGKRWLANGETIGWKWFQIAPTFGGGSNPVPHDQYVWIDHIYASVK